MALGSNRNVYQEYFLGGKGGWCIGPTTLTTFICQMSRNLGASTIPEPSGLVQACNGITLPFLFNQTIILYPPI
jgi:hypothetical protein